jgi:probable rRNA maturation factor
MPERRNRKRPQLTAEVVEDSGDWSWVDDIEALADATAAEVATEPGLKLQQSAVSIVLSSDASVAVLNGRYRKKPKPTNVLSFPPGPGSPEGYIGDIVLATETIGREAEEQDIPREHHLQHLIVHGLLHLLGHDHETDAEAERMEALEIKILQRLGVANPYTGALERDKRQ